MQHMTYEAVKTYTFKIGEGGNLSFDDPDNTQNVSNEVDQRVRAFMQEQGEKDYRAALHRVLHKDPGLKARYAGTGT